MLPLMRDAYNLARWLMRNERDAEDAVQEAYLKAFRFFGGLRPGTDGRAWLLRIVRNTCYSALQERNVNSKTVALDEAGELEDASPDPQARLAAKTTVQTVREAIAELPADYREALVLRELEGLSYKQISEVAGIPLGTVMSRLSRARDQLYSMLRERKEQDQL